MKKILNEFKVNKNNVNITIKKVINEFNKQLKQYRYFDIANEILGKQVKNMKSGTLIYNNIRFYFVLDNSRILELTPFDEDKDKCKQLQCLCR